MVFYPSPHSSELNNQLEHTIQAKRIAEELAHSYLLEIERLQSQLELTEDAKANAEVLAISRHGELAELANQLEHTIQAKLFAEEIASTRLELLNLLENQIKILNDELTKVRGDLFLRNKLLNDIQKSFVYKMMAVLRITPKDDLDD